MNENQWGDTSLLTDMHYSNALWALPKEVKYTPRPQGRLSNAALVRALIRDDIRARGVACLCPSCLGVDKNCFDCLGDGYTVGLPVVERVADLPL